MIHVTGTLINAGTVLAGTTAGTVLGDRLPERVREIVMDGLGLVVLLQGIDQGLAAFRPPLSTLVTGSAGGGVPVLIVLGSILLGGIAGEIIGIERGLVSAGDALKRRFGSGQARFTEGFVVASLVFCVGPLTILGAINDGLSGDYSLLAVKAMLDGFAALAFASTLGWGVALAAVTVAVYQGALTAFAGVVHHVLTTRMILEMTATGGLMVVAIGLRLLDLARIRIASLLPGLVIAPIAVALFAR